MGTRVLQVDSVGCVGLVGVETAVHAVELEIQLDFTAHIPAEPRVGVVLEEPDLDGCEHQVDLTVAIEVVPIHRELDAVRLDRELGAPRVSRPVPFGLRR